ncbi:metallophosphoesterase family protein [Mesorhizobium sp. M1409]|uniref:metallophosphoesterase family protein n=1 Tax=unclassified Mesorhizobium TaxID=325217 RepID=UPI00333712C9
MSTFLTADTHFGHPSIILNCSRPYASVDEMDAALIDSWNRTVHPRDTVWHLGDFAVGHDEARVAKIFHALNGQKKLILGNHDVDRNGNVLKSLSRLPWASVAHAAEVNHDGQRIALSHYAGFTWSAEHHGAYQAYGHSHGKLLGMPGSVDVGVDAQDYRPISVEEFIQEADYTIEHADQRIEDICLRLMNKAPQYAARDGALKFRERQTGRRKP